MYMLYRTEQKPEISCRLSNDCKSAWYVLVTNKNVVFLILCFWTIFK